MYGKVEEDSWHCVDNDVMVLAMLLRYCEHYLQDISIAWCTDSGLNAISRCRSGACPDVIVVDMSMGSLDGSSIDGPTTIHRIREYGEKPSIVAMTSFPLKEYAEKAASAGAQALVSKAEPWRWIQ